MPTIPFHYGEGRVDDVFIPDIEINKESFSDAPLAKSFNAHTTNPQYDYNNNIVKDGNQGYVATGASINDGVYFSNIECTTLYKIDIDTKELTSK